MPDRCSRNTTASCARRNSPLRDRWPGPGLQAGAAWRAWAVIGLGLTLLAGPGELRADDAWLINPFGDPFVQATRGLSDCPVPDPPRWTAQQVREQAHYRAERGTSCYRAGRCRLPNAYLYDREIAERALRAIDHHGGFADTSVWLEGQRRWVTLKGCVRTPQQSIDLEQLIRSLDDVEAVINELQVRRRSQAQ